MAEFHTYLCLEAPALVEADPDKQSVLDGVKATVRPGAGGWRGSRLVWCGSGCC